MHASNTGPPQAPVQQEVQAKEEPADVAPPPPAADAAAAAKPSKPGSLMALLDDF